MSSRDEEVYMEFSFIKENSVSQREKVKAFWKFLDAQNCLQPHKGNKSMNLGYHIRSKNIFFPFYYESLDIF